MKLVKWAQRSPASPTHMVQFGWAELSESRRMRKSWQV